MEDVRDYLDGWVTIWNPHTKLYMAAERENINDLWNDYSSSKVVKAADRDTLEAVIIKGKGDLLSINKLGKI